MFCNKCMEFPRYLHVFLRLSEHNNNTRHPGSATSVPQRSIAIIVWGSVCDLFPKQRFIHQRLPSVTMEKS